MALIKPSIGMIVQWACGRTRELFFVIGLFDITVGLPAHIVIAGYLHVFHYFILLEIKY